MSSSAIDAMIAEVRGYEVPKIAGKNQNNDCDALKKLCVETFEKNEKDLANVTNQLKEVSKKREKLDFEFEELQEQIAVRKWEAEMNATLTEEYKKTTQLF